MLQIYFWETVYIHALYYGWYCVGLEAWITLQKSKTAVKALLRDITVSDHQPDAIFPKVSLHLLPATVWFLLKPRRRPIDMQYFV